MRPRIYEVTLHVKSRVKLEVAAESIDDAAERANYCPKPNGDVVLSEEVVDVEDVTDYRLRACLSY